MIRHANAEGEPAPYLFIENFIDHIYRIETEII